MSRIKIAQFGAAHGLRGQIKIRCFLDDPSLIERMPLMDSAGVPCRVRLVNHDAAVLLAIVEGVQDRTQAEALRNKELFATQQAVADLLPHNPDEGEFLHQLIGLQARLEDGVIFGTVEAVYNFGASDILEIKETSTNQLHMIAYTHDNIPSIHIHEGYLVLCVPELL
ncbi:MAG: 16S rRNA processing protein RimM [Alphaproteobacteria bacterium]|nr:MAG: 16S rRNA processing protein RimM [Alphaproteobacteria bacterium]TAF14132.1 MAG: 16S rRNA processing protein RimM [Alphaproteobacteria bacterium]TAF39063.1 MAG: 16S rRNA processing protein RimM [Alphaproteobacteria bacterium]TAF75204.1 MAG: 16S rRNA processing protein RimM [Alphaproteobacteria bacterium]